MKKVLAILLCVALLGLPLSLGASAAEFGAGEKPWWILPGWLRLQYALKSWVQMGFREDSLVILHEGKIVYEEYRNGYDKDTPHVNWSVTKSVLSAMVGIAVKDGSIGGVQDKAASYYPDAVIAAGQESKNDMTIEHLLTMRSGLPTSTDCMEAPDAGLAAFESAQKAKPGARWTYNSGAGPQTLVGIVQRASGRNLLDYANEKLFEPLGITSVTWEAAKDGSNIGGYGIYMTPRDMLRFGLLYLHDGVWEGQRILPAGWVQQSQPKNNNTMLAYGYLFWGNGWDPFMGRSYEARGMLGQFITVYPEKDVVVVRTGH